MNTRTPHDAAGTFRAAVPASPGATPDAIEPGTERKDAEGAAFATLQAHAERAGAKLQRLAGGGYVVSRWQMARELPDLAAVGAFLRRMGARA